MRSFVIRSMTWWISGLTRELVVFVWMWSIWSVRSQIRKSSAMVPCSILTWRKWIKRPLETRICSQWEKLGEQLQRLPSNIPIQKSRIVHGFQFEHIVFNTNRVNQEWCYAKELDVPKSEGNFTKWQTELGEEEGWSPLFGTIHDLPRIVSTWGMMGTIGQICQGFSDSASLDEGNSLYLSRRRNWDDQLSI